MNKTQSLFGMVRSVNEFLPPPHITGRGQNGVRHRSSDIGPKALLNIGNPGWWCRIPQIGQVFKLDQEGQLIGGLPGLVRESLLIGTAPPDRPISIVSGGLAAIVRPDRGLVVHLRYGISYAPSRAFLLDG